MKTSAYSGGNKIRDLYDITYIVNNMYEELNPFVLAAISDIVSYKGLEHFDYITETQEDELIDKDRLAEEFLRAYDKLGLLYEQDEHERIVNEHNLKVNSEKEHIAKRKHRDLDINL